MTENDVKYVLYQFDGKKSYTEVFDNVDDATATGERLFLEMSKEEMMMCLMKSESCVIKVVVVDSDQFDEDGNLIRNWIQKKDAIDVARAVFSRTLLDAMYDDGKNEIMSNLVFIVYALMGDMKFCLSTPSEKLQRFVEALRTIAEVIMEYSDNN